ncbi:MAG TPA: SAM-dependent methyltransferase [Candidatus Saccharimonadales bacterium]|nr:SAM-dependent methyltransferase [Candidatus Saccharimonadales bacterium]
MTAAETLPGLLRRRLREAGRIPFSEFMAAALYEPGLGRYCRADPPMGPAGDYVTSPEVDRAFGLLIGRAVAEMWERAGGPDPRRPFTIIEAGPGRGTLCRDILSGLASERPDLHAEARYLLVESSGPLREAQQDLLKSEAAAAGKVAWRDWRSLLEEGPFRGCIVANELLDAFPVHLVERAGGRLREIYVELGEGDRLVEAAGDPATPEIAEYFERLEVELEEGQRAEVNLEALRWVREAGSILGPGYLLVVDYGHEAPELFSERHHGGTLLGYRRHRLVTDPLESPGDVDLTAHVDFTSLAAAARAGGFGDTVLTTQRNLLVAMGLPALIAGLAAPGAGGGEAERVRRRFALHTLMHPSGMGEIFRVFIAGRDLPVRGLRSAANPFREPVERGGGGVYDETQSRESGSDRPGSGPLHGSPRREPEEPRGEPAMDTSDLRALLRRAASAGEAVRLAVEAVHDWSDAFTWTGVYLLDGSELVLSHQIGRPTPHVRIPLDKGICGAAAREGETIVVDDVNADPRYLACSLETRSEIVVPLRGKDGRILGEIDIDSDLPAAFGERDRRRLEEAAAALSERIDQLAGGLAVRAPAFRPGERPRGGATPGR